MGTADPLFNSFHLQVMHTCLHTSDWPNELYGHAHFQRVVKEVQTYFVPGGEQKYLVQSTSGYHSYLHNGNENIYYNHICYNMI